MSSTGLLKRVLKSFRRNLSRPARTLDPLQAYELWAERYDDENNNALLFAEEKAVRPSLKADLIHNKDVLDAGCGAGRYLRFLQQFQPRSLTGTDFSPNMIAQAKTKFASSDSLSLQVAHLERLPFEDVSFDVVLCTLVLGHVQHLISAMSELARVLRSGGTLIISDFHPFGYLLGWQRTFQDKKDEWLAVKYYTHLHSEYFDCFQHTGLELVRMEEPKIDESLRLFYEDANRMDIYDRDKGYPLLLILEARKR
jgi:malonyl-CoA O-methyltransferase